MLIVTNKHEVAYVTYLLDLTGPKVSKRRIYLGLNNITLEQVITGCRFYSKQQNEQFNARSHGKSQIFDRSYNQITILRVDCIPKLFHDVQITYQSIPVIFGLIRPKLLLTKRCICQFFFHLSFFFPLRPQIKFTRKKLI